jgi:hypothetical protein
MFASLSERDDKAIRDYLELAPGAQPTAEEVAVIEAIGDKAAKAIGKWLRSSSTAGRFGSESWALRKRLAECIEQGDWKKPEEREAPY